MFAANQCIADLNWLQTCVDVFHHARQMDCEALKSTSLYIYISVSMLGPVIESSPGCLTAL